MAKNMFIVDFDGVLCDSVQECVLSTYNAYHRLQDPSFQRVLDIEAIEPTRRETFRKLRPYLKGAEDFIPIFVAIEQERRITSQKEFDALKAEHKHQLSNYLQVFYAERDFLIRNEKKRWLRLNPLFDEFAEELKQRPSFEGMHILTTKRQEDVLAIFQYQEIPFPVDQITYIKATGKSQKLLEILQKKGADMEESVYVEDQVDFLIEAQKHHIRVYLAEWGYVSNEQRELARKHNISMINIQKFKDYLRSFQPDYP